MPNQVLFERKVIKSKCMVVKEKLYTVKQASEITFLCRDLGRPERGKVDDLLSSEPRGELRLMSPKSIVRVDLKGRDFLLTSPHDGQTPNTSTFLYIPLPHKKFYHTSSDHPLCSLPSNYGSKFIYKCLRGYRYCWIYPGIFNLF